MMAGDGGGGGNMCGQYVADCSGKFHYRKTLTASMTVLKILNARYKTNVDEKCN